MKKDQKLQLQSSGSLEQQSEEAKETPATAAPTKTEQQKADDLFRQILDATMIDSLIEESFGDHNYIVESEDGKALWLLSLSTKSFKRIPNRAEITMLDKIDEDISHCLIYNDLFEVKNELIKDIGWH